MLCYRKENGFPISIDIETQLYKETMEDGEIWEGCKSVVKDENGNKITEFFHNKWHDRTHWAEGFFKGLTYETNKQKNEQ